MAARRTARGPVERPRRATKGPVKKSAKKAGDDVPGASPAKKRAPRKTGTKLTRAMERAAQARTAKKKPAKRAPARGSARRAEGLLVKPSSVFTGDRKTADGRVHRDLCRDLVESPRGPRCEAHTQTRSCERDARCDARCASLAVSPENVKGKLSRKCRFAAQLRIATSASFVKSVCSQY